MEKKITRILGLDPGLCNLGWGVVDWDGARLSFVACGTIKPDAEEPMGLFYSQHKGFGELFDAAVAKVDEVEAGTTDPKEAARYIFGLVRNAKFNSAANHLGDPEWHFINAGAPITTLKTLLWLVTSAPPDIRGLTLGLLGDVGGSSKPHQVPSARTAGA